MRGLIDDLRYGVSELLKAPRAGSWSAAWLLGGVLPGLGLARWVDAPLPSSPKSPCAVPTPRRLES